MLPRVMLSAISSGSGKTLITCGILKALMNRNKKVMSFKCGPDYIDGMFHTKIIGTKSRNLDSFFCDENTLKYFRKNVILVEAIFEGKTIAAGFYFIYNKTIHIHLS